MSARPVHGRVSLLSAALARAEEWLLDPAPEREAESARPERPDPSPVVVVVGLGRRRGASTIARGLAASLASRHRARAAILAGLSSAPRPQPSVLGTLAAIRLARSLRPALGEPVSCCGRLCLVAPGDRPGLAAVARPLAPLVIDVGPTASPRGVASLADAVVLVAAPEVQPALAELTRHSLGHLGPRPVVVLNRSDSPDERWAGSGAIELPYAPAAARLSIAGHEPAGALGAGLRRLAELLVPEAT